MTSESIERRRRERRAEDELADAIETVSPAMAERILGRAIEMDAQRLEEARRRAATFDYDDLKSIAEEVGITEEALREALREEFNTDKDHDPTITERLTLPDAVRGGVIVAKSQEELASMLDRVVARVRAANAEVVPQRDRRRSLVEVEARTSPLRKRAVLLIALFFILGPALAQALASLLFLGIAVVAIAGVVAWVKGISRRVRRAVNRALGELAGGDGEPESWFEVWERSAR